MYDPLGLLAPVILTGKILLQGSWKEKSNWDAPLSDDLRISCDKWCEELRNHDTVRITRWIGCHPEQQLDLHLFTDASEKALGCCIYVCGVSTQQLIYAKTRVEPLKLQTIARLELQAAYLGSKCLKFVCEELRFRPKAIFAWTDSATVWHWLQKPAYEWITWVANHVAFILDVQLDFVVKWLHCPGQQNPADVVSRGCPMNVLLSGTWFNGPPWMKNENQWPAQLQLKMSGEVLQTVRHPSLFVNSMLVSNRWWERLSVWTRVVGLGARLLQCDWISNCEVSG